MFTGIISELGTVQGIKKNSRDTAFTIHALQTCKGLKIGDSVAVNGACHTVVHKTKSSFTVESIPETLKRTNLGDLKVNSKVNLERPVQVGGRLDGHIVTGHIDSTIQVAKIVKDKNAVLFEFTVPRALTRYIVAKGSVALDGISLTVIQITSTKLIVGIIPHTIEQTNLKTRKIGDQINLEVDILAKHTEKLLKK